MTIYEQIQTALDYMEDHLNEKLTCEKVASSVNMSLRSFYNHFWIISGYRYGEFLRKRRLSQSLDLLQNTELGVLNVALESGYESHEAFTRAFRSEYGVSPSNFRRDRYRLKKVEKIKLIEEMYMGVIVKNLKREKVVCYTGFSPEPENSAHDRIWEWAKANGYGGLYGQENQKKYRLFGHDTDGKGEGFSHKDNWDDRGYRVIMTVDETVETVDADLDLQVFEKGTFAVTGVEGDMEKGGEFIGEGWDKLQTMISDKGYKIKEGGRCFEEKLEPSKPSFLRLDLYLEIEK